MSLFEDSRYQYRDTFFVFFDRQKRPTTEQIVAALESMGDRYQIANVHQTDSGFESLSVISPYDCSAMDIVYEEGDEVMLQVQDLMDEFRSITLSADDAAKLGRVQSANARFDIYHFERVDSDESGDDLLDPGGLLIVMQKLGELVDGVGLDPQSQSLL